MFDCDGTSCGTDLCDNDGQCLINDKTGPYCKCPLRHSGQRCELKMGCGPLRPCAKGGRCVRAELGEGKCVCPAGVTGKYCDEG